MKTTLTVMRLDAFELMPMHRCEPGRVFVDGGALFARTTINGFHLLAHLDHPSGASFSELKTHSGKVMALKNDQEFFVLVEPYGEPILQSKVPNLAGYVVLTDGGGALCGSLPKEKSNATDTEGRVAMLLHDMSTHFHDRDFPNAWEKWRIGWYSTKKEYPMLSLSRDE